MNIRSAHARDLEACLALDLSYESEYVWQLESTRASGVVGVTFRETRLPRAMRVMAIPARDLVSEHLERGECFLIAEEAGGVRGYLDATVEAWRQIAWIHHVTVAPEWRRRGIGGALVRAALNWAREHSLATAMIETSTKNHPATALFQKHGFTFCGFNERYYANRDIVIFFALDLR